MSKIQNEGFKSVAELEAAGLDNFTAKTKMLSDQKIYVGGDINKLLSDAIADGDIGGGGGVGGINYLPDVTDAEDPNVLENWATSEVGIQFVRNTTLPLRGTADYELNVENATIGVPGQISTEFTIDRADVGGKLLTITFDMRVNEWYTNDLAQIRIQEVTSGDIISVIGGDISGNESKKIAQFYTGATETNYRFIIAFDKDDDANPPAKLFFDNLILGPREVPKVAGPTEWAFQFDSSLDVDEYINEDNIAQSVTNPSTGVYRVYYNKSRFPSGPIVYGHLKSTDTGTMPIGPTEAVSGSDGSGDYVQLRTVNSNNAVTSLTANAILQVTFKQKQKDITQYRIATDLGSREIHFQGGAPDASGGTYAANTPFKWTTQRDTAGFYDFSNGQWTVPVDGVYRFEGQIRTTGLTGRTFNLYIDGVKDIVLGTQANSSTFDLGNDKFLKRGQVVDIRADNTFAIYTAVDPDQWSNISVSKAGNDSPIIAPPTAQIAIFKDVKPLGVDGGTSSLAFATRDLNRHEGLKTFATLLSNEITLTKGKYLIDSTSPFFSAGRYRTRIYDVTNSQVLQNEDGNDILSDSGFVTAASGGDQSISTIKATFVLSQNTTIRLEGAVQTTFATSGLGVAGDFAEEVYSIVKIQKIY